MANSEIVGKIREAMKDPNFWVRLAEAQKRAQETIDYMREASTVDINALKRVHYNI
jgi:hypothetical protein